MIIIQTFAMARWQIVVKKSEATKNKIKQKTTKTNKQTNKPKNQNKIKYYVQPGGKLPSIIAEHGQETTLPCLDYGDCQFVE